MQRVAAGQALQQGRRTAMSSLQMPSVDEVRELMHGSGDTKLQEAAEDARKQKQKEKELHDEFLKRDLAPDLVNRLALMVRKAAERGEKEVTVFTFPSKFCSDRGRAINNADPNWPQSLEGVAKRGYEFFQRELKPQGYRLQAQIQDFPEGLPGDVGFKLSW
jgi:hypothetical protein